MEEHYAQKREIRRGKGEGLYFEHGQTMFKLPQEKWVDFLLDKIRNWKKD